MLSFTLGAPEWFFCDGRHGAVVGAHAVQCTQVHGVFPPNIAHGIATREKADDLVATWRTRLESLMSETPLSFPALEMFQGLTLTKEAKEKALVWSTQY